MPRRTLLSSEQRTRLFAIPTDPGRDGEALRAQRRRPGPRPGQAARESTGWASPSSFASCGIPAGAGSGRAAARGDARLRGANSSAYRPRCSPTTRAGTRPAASMPLELQRHPGPAQLRAGRLARLPSGRRGRGMGHGSRRTHRPGDARPSADEQRAAAGGGGAGADRAGRACPRAQEDLRGPGGRTDRCRARHARRACWRSIRNCAAPASPGCGIIRSRPRPPTSSRCWIGSNTRAALGSTPSAPDAFMPPASPG